MQEVIDWFGSRPWHFFSTIIGICFCCFCLSNACVKISEAELKYQADHDKIFWQRSHPNTER